MQKTVLVIKFIIHLKSAIWLRELHFSAMPINNDLCVRKKVLVKWYCISDGCLVVTLAMNDILFEYLWIGGVNGARVLGFALR